MKGGTAARIAVTVVIAMLTSCVADPVLPAPDPPVIEWVGVPDEIRIGQTVTYVQPDGGIVEVEPDGYRTLTSAGWSGELIILGGDADGMFVAAFMRHDGLPESCYVENEVGVERGEHIETRGVLWPKSPTFQTAEAVAPDTRYPAGTRFCFDRTGRIVSTVGQ